MSAVDTLVGYRIRQVRTRSGMSREALGRAIGASAADIEAYEAGAVRVGARRLGRIAAALGVGVASFLEDDVATVHGPATLPQDG